MALSRFFPRERFGLLQAGAAMLLALLCSCTALQQRAHHAPLRVMTFNVRLITDADGPNCWDARRDIAVRMLRSAAPDLIGTQELHKPQGDYLVARLPDYAWFGRDRRGGDGDEHMGVFYRKARLRVIEAGDFALSDTPDVPGSISWGHPYPRMVTWALFERIGNGRRFYLFNTHLPYREEDEDARVRGARLLLSRIAALPSNVPVVVTGDFNAAPDSPTHSALTQQLRDAWPGAETRAGPGATFHNFTGRPDRRIDWVLTRGFHVRFARTIDAAQDGRYPSDHFPVMVDLE